MTFADAPIERPRGNSTASAGLTKIVRSAIEVTIWRWAPSPGNSSCTERRVDREPRGHPLAQLVARTEERRRDQLVGVVDAVEVQVRAGVRIGERPTEERDARQDQIVAPARFAVRRRSRARRDCGRSPPDPHHRRRPRRPGPSRAHRSRERRSRPHRAAPGRAQHERQSEPSDTAIPHARGRYETRSSP